MPSRQRRLIDPLSANALEEYSFLIYLVISAILVGLVSWIMINRRLFADAFSPLSILAFSWGLPLALRGLGLSDFESEWDMRTLLTIGWVTFGLVTTSVMFASLVRRRGSFSEGQPVFNQLRIIFQSRGLLSLLVVFWVISFAAYLYAEFITNPAGIPLVTLIHTGSLPSDAFHRWGKGTRWAIITPLLFVLTPMLYLAFRSQRQRSWKLFCLGLALAFPFMGLLKLSRSDIFVAFLNIALVEHYWRKYFPVSVKRKPVLSLMKYSLVLLAILGLIYGTLALRTGSGSNLYAHYIGFRLTGQGPWYELLAQIYGYAALPFENFHLFFASYPGAYNPGISALRPLLSITGLGRVADQMLSQIPYTAISPAARSSTFLMPLYAEFNIEGVLIIPILYGLLVNSLYLRFRIKPSFANFLLYLNFVYPWAWLYFNNAFSALTFYLNAGFIVSLALFIVEARSIHRKRLMV